MIDTGLSLKGNPLAGQRLEESSPELDYESHGTAAVGTAASESFGVNPKIHIVALPTVYRSSQRIENQLTGNVGFNHASLSAKWREAIDDKTVKVINLSMSHGFDPAVTAFVREALNKGKWIVYSAGNDGGTNSAESAAMSEFRDVPGFFVSGALSYLSAPSSFSHVGPGVKWFSPGVAIESLNGDYNPNLFESNPQTVVRGTSFSAPHLAAVLDTLVAIYPKLTATQAEWLLEKTAIRRGVEGQFLQVNPYHAVEVLDRAANKTWQWQRRNFDRCLQQQFAKLEKETNPLFMPVAASREDWIAHFDDLRKDYFLSGGRGYSALAIQDFLQVLGRELTPQAANFAPAAQELRYVDRIKPEGNSDRKERDRAIAQLSGTSKEVPGRSHSLAQLPALPENVDAYLAKAKPFLFTGEDSAGAGDLLRKAHKPFLMTLGERLVTTSRPLASFLSVGLVERVATTPAEKLIAAHLFDLGLQGWKIKSSLDTAVDLAIRIPEMTPEQRVRFARDFEAARAKGNLTSLRSYSDPKKMEQWVSDNLAIWLPDEAIKGRETELSTSPSITGGIKHPAVGHFIFAATRYKAGYVNESTLAAAAAELFRVANDKSIAVESLKDSESPRPLTYAFELLGKTPEGAAKVATWLLAGDHLAVTNQRLAKMSDVIEHLLPNLDLDTGKRLLTETVVSGGYSSEDYGLIYQKSALPAVTAFLEELRLHPQSDPGLQKMRLEHLKVLANHASGFDENAEAYFNEVPGGGAAHLYDLPLSSIIGSEKWRAVLEAQFASSRDSGQYLSWWLKKTSEKDFAIVAPLLAKHFANAWRHSSNVASYEISDLGSVIAHVSGSDKKLMAAFIEQGTMLLDDPEFGARPEREGWNRPEYRRIVGVMRFLIRVGTSKGGEQYFRSHPDLVNKIADLVITDSDCDFLDYGRPLPPVFLEALQNRLSTPAALVQGNRVPRWMEEVLQYPAFADQVLTYLKDPDVRGNPSVVYSLKNCLESQLQRSPALLKKFRAAARETPEIPISEVLELFGYSL